MISYKCVECEIKYRAEGDKNLSLMLMADYYQEMMERSAEMNRAAERFMKAAADQINLNPFRDKWRRIQDAGKPIHLYMQKLNVMTEMFG